MKSSFYQESLESMQNISEKAKERGWTYFDIIFLIWKAFRIDDDERMRKYISNWIKIKTDNRGEEYINE
tara:strand:- start:391 stop:597 length:207 start_codon:yes stop_codon:yes gene_type:complete